jgi:rusticyanin
MQPNRTAIVIAALASALTLGAVSSGYLIAQSASRPSYGSGSQDQVPGRPVADQGTPSPAASPQTASPPAASAPAASMPAMSMSPASSPGPSDGSPFSDPSLAQYVAQKAGTGLAGKAPQNVPASQVRALSDQVPAGASVDPRANTVTFTAAAVSFTVVAIAPGKPDMTFTIAGLTNPTIVVPAQSRVTVRFINNDTDEAHGWLITDHRPPFDFGQPATPAIAGAYAGVVGNPTAAGDGANTITFTASQPGRYQYICPMPGHAQMGMHGSFVIG